ncbi:hypothetical protein AVEN_48642-1 [Araneus ventricosus]|uniref:Uncharacterized protein n=1 Tax=Araneus ventricosus TaxID=182803 RepID=A0A4Y2S7P5_ARAVE|nr:hypothetical protein AVEN_48642-1 [Araneus ventricosus]
MIWTINSSFVSPPRFFRPLQDISECSRRIWTINISCISPPPVLSPLEDIFYARDLYGRITHCVLHLHQSSARWKFLVNAHEGLDDKHLVYFTSTSPQPSGRY